VLLAPIEKFRYSVGVCCPRIFIFDVGLKNPMNCQAACSPAWAIAAGNRVEAGAHDLAIGDGNVVLVLGF
jgi:hypothetical protein